jgi:predicted nucleic acid-binding protein
VVVVDTSVWIEAHRHPSSARARALGELLDADEVALPVPVRLELAAGVSRRDKPALLRGLAALPILAPSQDTWNLIERWVPAAADKGLRFGLADWLIAALADEIGGLVWSLDDDFEQLERLKMCRRYDV